MSISGSSKVLVASDQHLGYVNSEVDCFNAFLDFVSKRSDIGQLVILGDWVDMWRRDVSGLYLEFRVSIESLLAMSKSIKVIVVAGNHDYHELDLIGSTYGFQFLQNYSFVSGNTTYVFKHGWEFDYAQQPPVMELLCHNLSNTEGADLSDIYSHLTNLKTDLEDLFEFHGGPQGYVKHLMTPPEQRLQPYLGDVEKRAFSSISPGQKLIFGHTHRPFVSSDGNVANSGSWVTDAAVHNTYVELDGQTMKLFQIDASENVTELSIVENPPS
jgi:UDP-2,3-diacylglucosamine pyrophosphatase LpxH